jgi:hypothetical protein
MTHCYSHHNNNKTTHVHGGTALFFECRHLCLLFRNLRLERLLKRRDGTSGKVVASGGNCSRSGKNLCKGETKK